MTVTLFAVLHTIDLRSDISMQFTKHFKISEHFEFYRYCRFYDHFHILIEVFGPYFVGSIFEPACSVRTLTGR